MPVHVLSSDMVLRSDLELLHLYVLSLASSPGVSASESSEFVELNKLILQLNLHLSTNRYSDTKFSTSPPLDDRSLTT